MAVDREVKRSIKKDKRDYIDDLARQAETTAGQGNLRDLYLVTKKLTGKFQQTDKPVMDKNGNPLTTTNSWNDGQNTSGSCWTAPLLTHIQMLYSLFSKIWEKEEVPA